MKLSKFKLGKLVRNIAAIFSLVSFLAWAWFGAGDTVLLVGQIGMVVSIILSWLNRSTYESM